MFDFSKSRLVTNKRLTMLGFISSSYSRDNVLMWGLKSKGSEYSFYNIEVNPQYMVDVDVEGPEDFIRIRDNTHILIEDMKADVITREAALCTRRATLEEVSKKEVVNSQEAIEQVIKEAEENEESARSGYTISIKEDSLVGIPYRCCPYFYLTNDDLTQFNMGDIVEVEFGKGSRVAAQYKGKTLQFIVNNFLEYGFRRPTKRLALIPLTEGWTQDDVLILDDYDRFECLMTDLFPENRIPFRGWKSKEVTIKKAGQIEQMPKANVTEPTVSYLKSKTKDEILLRKGSEYRGGKEVSIVLDVGKQGDMPGSLVFTFKIYTSRDKKDAIDFLNSRIKEIKEGIVKLKGEIEDKQAFAAGIQYFEDLNYFNKGK